jgi:hypothetical protein
MRRIGVLMHTGADEPEAQARLAAFTQFDAGWHHLKKAKHTYPSAKFDIFRRLLNVR